MPQGEASDHERGRPELSAELIGAFKEYIHNGEALIKEGKYTEAITHFMNSAEAEKVGWEITPARSFLLAKKVPLDKIGDYAFQISANSSSQGGRINLSMIIFADSVPQQERVLPIELQEQIAVIYLEEWLHALQEITGKPLTDKNMVRKTMEEFDVGPESEVDMGLYFKQNGIPISPIFLEAYSREKYLKD